MTFDVGMILDADRLDDVLERFTSDSITVLNTYATTLGAALGATKAGKMAPFFL
jgi:hypothetical protein